jgi:FkbM family methyltransferase
MIEKLKIGLPNGKVCYFNSIETRTVAKILRWEIFKRGQYRRPGFELRADDTVIDIGANIGMFALWAAPQIPRGRLICVEPNPEAVQALRMNILRNDLSNAIAVPAAAGDADGTMELLCRPGWEPLAHSAAIEVPWWYTNSAVGRFGRWLVLRLFGYARGAAPIRSIAVPQVPLSRIMDEHGVATVNFLKIDCEGSEYEVLRSVDAAHWRRIERLVIEYHDFGPGRDHRELLTILRNNGFEAKAVHKMLERLWALAGIRVGVIWARKSPSP